MLTGMRILMPIGKVTRRAFVRSFGAVIVREKRSKNTAKK